MEKMMENQHQVEIVITQKIIIYFYREGGGGSQKKVYILKSIGGQMMFYVE